MNRLHIAQVAHEVNRAYCDSIGDTSQLPWADAPQWQKDSALAGVDMHTANPGATPEQSHESWLAQKAAEGWTYGEHKDVVLRQHPCMRPYSELPPEQKAKDYLFRGVVHALLALPVPEPIAAQPPVNVAAVVAASVGFAAPVSAIAQQVANGVLVRYVGKETWPDRLYGSKLSFEPQQQRRVPGDLAQRFLRHADMFQPGTEDAPAADPEQQAPAGQDDTAEVLEKTKKDKEQEDTEQRLHQDMLDTVNQMDKDALKSFAQERFGQNVSKAMSLENMRARVAEFVTAYGV